MSGGAFNYQQYRIEDIAVKIDEEIESNDDETLNEWKERNGRGYPPEIIEKFREVAHTLRRAAEMAQLVDCLISSDDSEKSFLAGWGKKVRPAWTSVETTDRLPRIMQTAMVFAARYTHNRSTSGSMAVIQALSDCWESLDKETQKQILRESDEATCNRADWLEFKTKMSKKA